jgi:polysaccharide deacetylase 2 family uncharacterized protein YibQ
VTPPSREDETRPRRRRSRRRGLPRLARRIWRALRPRNLLTALAIAVSLLVVLMALTGPPRQPEPYRTDPVRKAMGLPTEDAMPMAEAQGQVPSLSASPRFVLPSGPALEAWALGPLPRPPAEPAGPAQPEPTPPAVASAEPTPPPEEPPVLALMPVEPPPPPVLEPAPAPAEPPKEPPRFVARPQLAPATQLAALVPPPAPRRETPPRQGTPRLAIVIDDLGPAAGLSHRATRLPRPVTLAFLPYASGLDGLVGDAKAHGHEIYLHLPMEPEGDEDPGPNAILTGLEPTELHRRLAWAFERMPQAVGVNNHMGSRASADPGVMMEVLQEVRRRGLAFVDSRTSPLSVGTALAERLDLRHAGRDVFLDNVPTRAAVRRQLDAAERLARRRGQALAIGHPHPATLEVLESWLPQAEARGLKIVTAGELVLRAGCPEPEAPIPVSACAGADCPPPPC